MRKVLAGSIFLLTIIAGLFYYFQYRQDSFSAPRQEAPMIQFRVSENATLDGVVSNLHYYDFIKDESAFRYALEHTEDHSPGNEGVIHVGNKTIKTQAVYEISQTMDVWQLAYELLNEGEFSDCSHGCPGMFYPELLPGGDQAPGPKEVYHWVESYDDCVKAKGQLSSEQYTERTGNPRKCVSPDGREFTEGQEGWAEFRGG